MIVESENTILNQLEKVKCMAIVLSHTKKALNAKVNAAE